MLEITDIVVKYGPIEAVRGVSLRVEEGEVVSVIGANGAGKTTLLGAVSGLKPPNSGHIRFRGETLGHKSPDERVKRGIAHVPQGRRIFPDTTVLGNLLIGAYTRRDSEGVQKDLEFFYQMFPILRARAGQTAGTLSGGEQQMLALCRGLMSRPKLLLLDEPSMGLAPKIVVSMFGAIRDLAVELGTAVLLAEQNVAEALRISDRGYVLETGEVVLEGTSEEIEHNPRVLEAYLGGCAPPEAGASDERR
ncbi:MAG: ABC transporter ATP-binding protein [Actinobacteria bacterium]|nr:ABC transporter ATP-binding protein [Actinomycetota bacterium]